MKTIYQVINVELHSQDVWSEHKTLEDAIGARRRYEKKNPLARREPSLSFKIRQVQRGSSTAG